MKYIAVSIGNSDDKLTQKEWNHFVEDMIELLSAGKVHFFGGASTFAPWQNVAWIVEIPIKQTNIILADIADLRKKYNQESAFVIVGDGLFI